MIRVYYAYMLSVLACVNISQDKGKDQKVNLILLFINIEFESLLMKIVQNLSRALLAITKLNGSTLI